MILCEPVRWEFIVSPSRILRDSVAALGVLGLVIASAAAVMAQSTPAKRALIIQSIDETELITLSGNTHPAIKSATDRGAVADGTMLNHMYLGLNRAPEVQRAVDDLVRQLHDPMSPQYHHWLTIDQIAERFGPAEEDVQTVSSWLASHRLTVNVVYPANGLVDFSGTAGSVRDAFHTEMHNLRVNGKAHIANMSDPQIPAALAPAIRGIVYLHDFRPHPVLRPPPPPRPRPRPHQRLLYTFSRESVLMFSSNRSAAPQS